MQATEKTALLTGASRGLGRALARGLAARGWNLILTARNAEQLAAVRDELAQRVHVAAIPGDVTDPAHRAAMAVLARGHGGLDAIINNAGALGPTPLPPVFDYPLDQLRAVVEANVIAPLGILQSVREALKPGARVLSITSDAATTPYPGWGGYAASKAALEQLTAVFAVENPSLKVYWVDPGDLRTDMHQAAFPGEDISDRPLPEVRVPALIDLLDGDLPSGRYTAAALGSVDTEVAGTAA
jgi:NAD(P)-dependent dehydrogenase (short-subunit alcohol dehydrogenase family)